MIWITTFIEVLTPPVEICLQCSKILTRHNNPFKVTVFETKRANSALELTLIFNDYGYATYGKKKTGYRYYKDQRPLIEATDGCVGLPDDKPTGQLNWLVLYWL